MIGMKRGERKGGREGGKKGGEGRGGEMRRGIEGRFVGEGRGGGYMGIDSKQEQESYVMFGGREGSRR